MAGWDPNQFLTEELEDMGMDPDEFGEYYDPYDWTPERLDQSDYSSGLDKLKGSFEATAMNIENQASSTGFESSYMEEGAEQTLYDQYFTQAGELEFDLAKDLFSKRKKYKEETWNMTEWLMELDPDMMDNV